MTERRRRELAFIILRAEKMIDELRQDDSLSKAEQKKYIRRNLNESYKAESELYGYFLAEYGEYKDYPATRWEPASNELVSSKEAKYEYNSFLDEMRNEYDELEDEYGDGY